MNTPVTEKTALVNSIAIMLSMPSQSEGLQKLTLPTLRAMYDGLISNANAWQLVQEEAKKAKTEVNISRGRIRVLEAEVNSLKAKLKGKK